MPGKRAVRAGGAAGRLRPEVERLLADPGTLAAAARLLLDKHFTPTLAELICAAVDLDVAALDLADSPGAAHLVPARQRRRGFAEEVLRAYAYQCAPPVGERGQLRSGGVRHVGAGAVYLARCI